ncbi:MAG TPA: GDSL-type esterase/lipase family protein [Chitinophaga sp.]|uniref:GDSL-type esterase/lipase family protein n=1 Tax=Chitinophaga sp. TaxID=1869181 RepID=UPI002DB5E72B|nr:GDSL-type esterase/lipase family protein [Chitinophaga sp.]HEU4554897.1 GDSL-type esterase/lipase family protein [Chitinophaga sp.]
MDSSKGKSARVLVFTGLLLMSVNVLAQRAPLAASGNIIQQDTALYRFFAALDKVDSNVVRILHLGDSHIQAGFFPVATGGALQRQFGNAGRGWVFPYNVAGTNGPDDYRWNSTVRWQTDRVIDRHKDQEPGPGGIVIYSQSAAPTLAFDGRQHNAGGMNDEVKEAQLFFDAGTPDVSVQSPGAAITVTPAPYEGSPTLSMATLRFPQTMTSFQTRWEDNGSAIFRFYGAILRNGQNGILYSAIGINGAMYQHYVETGNTIAAQMQVLQPQLVIISLGTNEAYSGQSAAAIREQVDAAVSLIREQLPGVSILLTTPPDCMRTAKRPYRKKVGKKYRTYYRIKYYPNPAINTVTQLLIDYCRQHGLACWNFNAVNKAMKSSFAGAWAPDHIHFNARGYQLQGRLLYEALRRSYAMYLDRPVTAAADTSSNQAPCKSRQSLYCKF